MRKKKNKRENYDAKNEQSNNKVNGNKKKNC